MESRYDAIVIGLGPVGSFMALKLEQRGMKVLAIDKEKDIYPLPRAVSMSDQGMRMHQSLYLDDVYIRNSDIPEGAGFVDENLEFIGDPMIMKGLNTHNGWPPMQFFHQPYTDREIREKLLNSNCDVFVGHELTDIDDADQITKCAITNLQNNEVFNLECRYLIGADGANSEVRDSFGITIQMDTYNQSCLVASVITDHPQQEITWQRFTSSGPQAFLPLPGHQASLVWYDQREIIDSLIKLDLPKLGEKFQENFPGELGLVKVHSRGSFDLFKHHAKNYVCLLYTSDAADE